MVIPGKPVLCRSPAPDYKELPQTKRDAVKTFDPMPQTSPVA